MPVLLLAQGDPPAKDLLRRAIEARYGFSPPAIDNIRLCLKGKVRARVGPITTQVPVDMMAQFRFPSAMRWDFNVKTVGVSLQRGIEAFDGTTYRRLRSSGYTGSLIEPMVIDSLHRRLWAMAALLLTPLGEHFVRLKAAGEMRLEATNTLIDDTVQLLLRPDHTLDRVQVQCLNPDSGREQRFTLRLSPEQLPINGLMLPARITAYWDDELYFDAAPTHAENEVALPDEIFNLNDLAQ